MNSLEWELQTDNPQIENDTEEYVGSNWQHMVSGILVAAFIFMLLAGLLYSEPYIRAMIARYELNQQRQQVVNLVEEYNAEPDTVLMDQIRTEALGLGEKVPCSTIQFLVDHQQIEGDYICVTWPAE